MVAGSSPVAPAKLEKSRFSRICPLQKIRWSRRGLFYAQNCKIQPQGCAAGGPGRCSARELYIRPEIAKTRVGRTLVLSPLTAQALARLLEERPQWWGEDTPLFASEKGNALDACTWAKRMAKYCQKEGVKVTPYGLRHTFAIEFLKASNDPFALQRILGHKDLTMTRRYIRYVQDDIREDHEKASPVAKLQQLGKRASRRL